MENNEELTVTRERRKRKRLPSRGRTQSEYDASVEAIDNEEMTETEEIQEVFDKVQEEPAEAVEVYDEPVGDTEEGQVAPEEPSEQRERRRRKRPPMRTRAAVTQEEETVAPEVVPTAQEEVSEVSEEAMAAQVVVPEVPEETVAVPEVVPEIPEEAVAVPEVVPEIPEEAVAAPEVVPEVPEETAAAPETTSIVQEVPEVAPEVVSEAIPEAAPVVVPEAAPVVEKEELPVAKETAPVVSEKVVPEVVEENRPAEVPASVPAETPVETPVATPEEAPVEYDAFAELSQQPIFVYKSNKSKFANRRKVSAILESISLEREQEKQRSAQKPVAAPKAEVPAPVSVPETPAVQPPVAVPVVPAAPEPAYVPQPVVEQTSVPEPAVAVAVQPAVVQQSVAVPQPVVIPQPVIPQPVMQQPVVEPQPAVAVPPVAPPVQQETPVQAPNPVPVPRPAPAAKPKKAVKPVKQERPERLERLERPERPERPDRPKRKPEVSKKPAKKRRVWGTVFAVLTPLLIAAGLFALMWFSDNNQYRLGVNSANDPDMAIEYFSKVQNPESSYYSQAKFNLGELLYEKGRYAEAAVAYNDAVASGKWEDYVSYSSVALALRYGTRDKALPIDAKKSADLYAVSPESQDRYKAACMYYDMEYYDDALPLFEEAVDLADNAEAKGCLGLMHLYGWGKLAPDAGKAWAYLKDSPDLPELAVAKGDLIMYLGVGSRNGMDLGRALNYYRQAAAAYPARKDVRYRCDVLENVSAAEKKYEGVSAKKRGRIYWDSYRLKDATYTGEVTNVGYGFRESYGWGWLIGDENSVSLGKHYYQKYYGLGLFFIPSGESFYMKVGEFSNDVLVDGFVIRNDEIQEVKDDSANRRFSPFRK